MANATTADTLIIGPSWVGDMVMAQSLFIALRRQQPTLNIDVLAPPWSEGLLQRMPQVRHILSHDFAHGELAWQNRRALGQQLRAQHYQHAIVLPNSWKSALVPFWANIPHRTGYVGEFRYGLLNDARPLDRLKLPRTVDRFIALGLSRDDARAGQWVPQPRLQPQPADAVLQRLNINYDPNRPILALCAGAEYGEAKRWPLEHFAIVARHKIAEGWQVWLFGSEKEAQLARRIEALAGEAHCVNLCGQTQLAEAVDLLALASAVVSNDSGLMHLAAALDRPLVAVFGSSDPAMTPPLNSQSKIESLRLSCSPCFQRTCPLTHLNCLRELKPTQVLAALSHLENRPDFLNNDTLTPLVSLANSEQ